MNVYVLAFIIVLFTFCLKKTGLRKFNTSLVLIVSFLIFSGCVAQKKKNDVGAIGKGYHNMTARYNGYYNASNLLLESQIELENQHKDNYYKILPIYKYADHEFHNIQYVMF